MSVIFETSIMLVREFVWHLVKASGRFFEVTAVSGPVGVERLCLV